MKPIADGNRNQAQARSLLAALQDAPMTIVPRREPITAWLNAYLLRAGEKGYVMGETETDDLAALDQFLRTNDVPMATPAAA